MDRFSVSVSESEVLRQSHLVSELQAGAEEMVSFPALVGEHVAMFHDVDGGYHESDDYHLVNLIHKPQGLGSPRVEFHGKRSSVELHLDDKFWQLGVSGFKTYDEGYPDEDFVLSLEVDNYRSGPHSFSDELKTDIDKRETQF